MFSTSVEKLVVRNTAARFAGAQGYRLEGDQAHLNAAVAVDDAARADADWALQLWACEQGGLQGIKVAELAVGRLPATGAANVEGWTVALPPAGQDAHTMVLALASGHAGHFSHIHDLAVFPAEERFCQPRMIGAVGYRFEGGQVELCVDAVSNPRDADNLSGSLSLELWALSQPYQGGAFEGVRIAGGDLECLAGQDSLPQSRLSLPATPLPSGTWRIVLMLREWTPAGFVTRDYANFSAPVVVAELARATAEAASAIAASVVAEPVGQPEPRPVPELAPAKGSKPAKAAARVSINTATEAELAAVKGLSKTVAAAIVAARPYAKLEDVVRAKGMGPKLLEKLRGGLAL